MNMYKINMERKDSRVPNAIKKEEYSERNYSTWCVALLYGDSNHDTVDNVEG